VCKGLRGPSKKMPRERERGGERERERERESDRVTERQSDRETQILLGNTPFIQLKTARETNERGAHGPDPLLRTQLIAPHSLLIASDVRAFSFRT